MSSNQYVVALGAAVGAGVACYTMLSSVFPDKPLRPTKQPTVPKVPPPPKVCEVAKPTSTTTTDQNSSVQVAEVVSETPAAKAVVIDAAGTSTPSSSGRQSPRAGDSLLTGVVAAATAAYQLSDVLFVYEAGDGNAVIEHVNAAAAAGLRNASGRTPSATLVSTRAGAGRVVLGAAATREAGISVFAPGQSLQLMQPVLKKLAKASAPVVLHVTAVKITDSLTYATDYSGIFVVRDSGAAIVASYSPQEAYQMALVSHLVAEQCALPVIHAFDAEVVARGSGTVAKLDSMNQLPRGKPSVHADSAADAFQATFNKLADSFNVGFKLFETPVFRPSAVRVVVLFGGAVGQLCAAAAEVEDDIHVIQVRVYRPWSPQAFINALPDSVRRLPRSASWSICVASVSARSGVQNSLVADVTTTLSSKLWRGPAPKLIKCTLLPESGGSSMASARAVIERLLSNDDLNRSLVLGSSFSDSFVGTSHYSNNATSAAPSIAVWGTEGHGIEALMGAVGERLLVASDMFHNSIVDSDDYHPSKPVLGRMTLYGDQTAPVYFPETYRATLLLAPELFDTHAHDIADSIGIGSVLYIATELRDNELLNTIPGPVKDALAQHDGAVVAFTSNGVGGLGNGVELALHALLGTPTSVASAVQRHVLPSGWKTSRSSEASSTSSLLISPKAFTRRLSLGKLTEDKPAPQPAVEDVEMVPEHTVSWNVMFGSGKQDTSEMLRPDEHDKVYQVRTLVNKRLTPGHYDRNVFHLEFDTTGTDLTYNIGDALGVFGHNDPAEVQEFIDFYGLKASDFVALPFSSGKELLSVEQLLKQRLDIFGKPAQKFYAAMAHYATDTYEAKKLKWMGSADKEAFKLRQLETVTFADVLREFQSAHPPFVDLIELVPPIKPRHYSIASSNKMHPNAVHLLVVAVDWVTPKGRKRYGQCTRYLAAIQPGDMVTVDIKPSICKLPEDPMQPVICAGLGTGLAPYRAFVQERQYLQSQGVKLGPMSLYFGARYRAEEYLYGDELDEAHRNGVITDLRLAFSRDQKHKVYIQHLILEDKEQLAGYFRNDQGYFYMCGPTWPVPDVKNAICEGLVASVQGFTMEEADEYLEELKEEGRYVLEVY